MATIILLFGTLLINDPSYYLFLKDGRLFEVQEMPSFEGRFCYFTLLSGEKSMMPSDSIDFEKTELVNKEMADKKKAELDAIQKAKATKAERALAKSISEEGKEPRIINLKGTWELEKYQNKSSNSSGSVVKNEEVESNILGKPRVQTWKSEDDIYLAKETISRTRQGYIIDCVLKTNQPSGVRNAKLKLSVSLDNDKLITMEEFADPLEIPFEGEGTIQFVLETEYLIVGTSYIVEAELP